MDNAELLRKFKYQYILNHKLIMKLPYQQIVAWLVFMILMQFVGFNELSWTGIVDNLTLILQGLFILDVPIVWLMVQLWIGNNKLAQLQRKYGHQNVGNLTFDQYQALYHIETKKHHKHIAKLIKRDMISTYLMQPAYWRRLYQFVR